MAEITYNIKDSTKGGIIIVLVNKGMPCGSLKIEDAEQNLVWEHVFEAPYFQPPQTMTIKIPVSALPSPTGVALKTLTITASHPWPDDEDAIITLNMNSHSFINNYQNFLSGSWIQFTLNL